MDWRRFQRLWAGNSIKILWHVFLLFEYAFVLFSGAMPLIIPLAQKVFSKNFQQAKMKSRMADTFYWQDKACMWCGFE